jgi:hypothetical protein
MVRYVTENFLAGTDVALEASSEDALYVLENLSNGRPSKPFRFTGHGTAGAPEYICVEFDAPKLITFFGLFNHNLTNLAAVADALILKGCDLPCVESGSCDWLVPDEEHSVKDRLVDGWNDLYHLFNSTRLAWRLEVIDTTNPAAVELGEMVLGQWTALTAARLQPGRQESPSLYRQSHKTHYGQHWDESLAYNVNLELVVSNLNNPAQVDAVRQMIMAVHNAGGHFIIIPSEDFPFCYYVALVKDSDFMSQVTRGFTRELTTWTFSLETLTKGVRLL